MRESSSRRRGGGATLGLLSLAFLGADTLSNLVWGYLGDKTGFRLVLAAPIRALLYLLTRDRVYLYRSAETAGFLVERTRLRRSAS